MLLKSLKLDNIRSYTNDIIHFHDGSSLLLGDIGAGKTTVLLGIEFALFGLIRGDVSGITLLRHGKSLGSVELSFELDGKNIVINRRLKRKNDSVVQDSGFIIIDDRKFDLTPVELKSKILELFGYPEELLNKNTSLIYRYTVYTPQEDMKAIIYESKDERLDTLRRIFNIDKYKRVRENALNYAKDLRNMKKILESKISDLDDRKNELSEKRSLLENVSKDKALAESEHAELKKAVDSKALELKDFESKIKELNGLRRDLAVVDANLKSRKSESERLKKELSIVAYRINEYENKLKEYDKVDDEDALRASLKDAEDKFSRINIAKETIKERLESKEDDLKNMIIDDQASLNSKRIMLIKRLDSKSDKENSFEDNKRHYDQTILDINSLKIAKNNSQEIIDQLKDLNVCPTCLQNVDFTHKIKMTDKEDANILSLDRNIVGLEKRRVELEKSLHDLKKDIEVLRSEEMELREIDVRLMHISSKIDSKKQLEKDIEDLRLKKDKLDKMDVDRLVDIISKTRKIISGLEVRKHVEESLKDKKSQKIDIDERLKVVIQDLADDSALLESLNERILGFVDVEKSFNDKRSDFDLLNKSLKDLEIRVSSINKDFNFMNQEIKRVNDEISIKLKVKEKISYLNELNYWITEHLVNLTAIIEKSIMQRVYKEFDALFKKWFDIMMDDDSLDVRIDEEFTPIIIQNNYETFIDNLSGGEKTSVALAYRLALNKVINDFISTIKTKDIIILDEPTDGFSSEQLDKMRDVLHELNIRQMIIVSHEAKMESYVQNIIRIGKNEHNSKVLAS